MFGLKNNQKETEEVSKKEKGATKNDGRLDFVGVGDAVTDTFIELIDAWIEDDNPKQKKELCMRFGDKIPYSNEVTVKGTGNALNAANAANELGLKTGIITDLGNDDIGKEV